MEPIKIHIRKPLYGNFVYIRALVVNTAIQQERKLEIQIPQGKAVVDPQWWKDTGKVMEKEFKIPGRPMVLYGNHVPLEEEKSYPQHTPLTLFNE